MGKLDGPDGIDEARWERMMDAEVEAVRESRVRLPLLKAYVAAFHAPVAAALDESTLRTIGNSYASLCFTYGPTPHPRTIEALRAAMDHYVAEHPEADALLFPGCPF